MGEHLSFNLRIDKMRLANYRNIREMEIGFDSSLTVLIARNSGGKSALLQALATALFPFTYALGCDAGVRGFAPHDHRLVLQKGGGTTRAADDMRILCNAALNGSEVAWEISRSSQGVRPPTRVRRAAALKDQAYALKRLNEAYETQDAPYVVAPVIVFYDSRRQSRRLTSSRKAASKDRFEGYSQCLTTGDSSAIFRDWFIRLSKALTDNHDNEQLRESIRTKLDTVRVAIDEVLKPTGFHDLHYDSEIKALVVFDANDVELRIEQMSDGIWNICSLVADIAHRAVRLNPGLKPCVGENGRRVLPLGCIGGIAMIDEVDMYLHPKWQQQILASLRKIFPRVQFIVSTHSPQVLSTAKKEQIRIISIEEDGSGFAITPGVSPFGRAASIALEQVMNTNEVPELFEDRGRLLEMQLAFRRGDFARGEKLRRELAEAGFEVDDEDIVMWKFIAGEQEGQ